MSYIHVDHLTFAYEGGDHNIFEDLTLELDTGWRLGLIGPNGRGKSTLLGLLSGALDSRGQIRPRVPCRTFPIPVEDPEGLTLEVMQAACPAAEEWELLREVGQLGLEGEALYRPFRTLSDGEQTRALLACLFLEEGVWPLIDEPTDHLDEAGRALVADYLRRQRGFLLVSHDRALLDGCVDHVLALERSGPRLLTGNYTTWRREWEAQNSWEAERQRQLRREVDQLRTAARQAGTWSDRVERSKNAGPTASGLKGDKGHIGHMAAKMAQRAKNIEARRLSAAAEKEKLLQNLERSEPLKLSPLAFQGRELLTLREVAPVYGGRPVCRPVALTLAPGERVALTGENGCGKSSLLRLLAGEEVAYTGELARPGRLKISYVPQDTGSLRGSLGEVMAAWGVDRTRYLTLLRKLGFERRQFERDLSALSAGQKKKLLLARSLCESAHLYLWDEPLNYLDLWARQQLEELLTAAGASLLFVEHDVRFRESVATRTVRVERA